MARRLAFFFFWRQHTHIFPLLLTYVPTFRYQEFSHVCSKKNAMQIRSAFCIMYAVQLGVWPWDKSSSETFSRDTPA